jgi:hypothetical protein
MCAIIEISGDSAPRWESLMMFRSNRYRELLIFATVILSLLAMLYIGRGLQQLVSSSGEYNDLYIIWRDLRLVLDRTNPYKTSSFPSLYPPFAYPAEIAFFWPTWPAVRYYFALVTLICLGFAARWAYRTTARHDPWFALALAMSIPATSAVSTGMGLGQTTILYTALLILVLQLREGSLGVAAGFVLGIAMSKISIALPFLLLFCFRRDWRILIAAGAYIVIGTAMVCVWLNESPQELVRLWIQATERVSCFEKYSLATFMCHLGLPAIAVSRAVEALVIVAAAAVFAWLRELPLVTLFGLAAGFGRLWTYHHVYDNFMLVILLVAIVDAYLRTEQWQLGAAMLAVGSTLWLPPKAADLEVIQILHLALWSAAIAALAVWAPRAEESTAEAVPALFPKNQPPPSDAPIGSL